MAIIVKRAFDFNALRETIGETIIGPIVNRWLLALHQHVSYLDDGDTEFLFCARAGSRIKQLYEAHIGASEATDQKGKMFWSSRLAVCKGTFRRFSAGAVETLVGEYKHHSLKEMVKGILRNQEELSDLLNFSAPEFAPKGDAFGSWLRSGTTDARIVINYLDRCGVAFDGYLSELLGGKKRAVLIDSGWQGTAQWMLSNAYPEIEWKGLYFGRIMSKPRPADFVDHVIGLLFEKDEYSVDLPITALVHFHHLVEMLLESGGPSIEEIPYGKFKPLARKQIAANQKSVTADDGGPLFRGVMNHIRKSCGDSYSVADIVKAYEQALPDFERIVLFPSRREAIALGSGDRSADFGKSLKVPVLRRGDEFEDESIEDRIDRSLWRPGQMALEFADEIAAQHQARYVGRTHDQITASRQQVPPVAAVDRSVAIITRTKNRPILLQRAAESVANQTHRDYIWVVVNDAGNIDAVREVIDACPVERHKILLIDNHVSGGMEAASNLGVANSQSRFVVIHDDDDAWAPDFLEKTTLFLTSDEGEPYEGVITKSVYVSEEIVGRTVVEHGREPYQDWARHVQIAEMARENFFPPIAFVFTRRTYEEIGGFNEALPVLGDWFFNMEFLLRADIGVIRSTTAFYHHRDVGAVSIAYSNSVIGSISKHEQYAAVARNMFLRKYASNLAAIAAISGYFAKETRRIENKLDGRPLNSATGSTSITEGSVDAFEEEYDRLWLINELNSKYVFSLVSNLTEYQQRMVSNDVTLDVLLGSIIARGIPIESPPNFDEAAYLRRYPDIAEACEAGELASGYLHYLTYGKAEGRKRYRKAA